MLECLLRKYDCLHNYMIVSRDLELLVLLVYLLKIIETVGNQAWQIRKNLVHGHDILLFGSRCTVLKYEK